MGYIFHGIFCEYDASLEQALREQWPQAAVQTIYEPFYCLGLRMPEADDLGIDFSDEETWEKATAAIYDQKDNLPVWSRKFPHIGFVYIDVECFGGLCDSWGYSCRNGEKLLEREGEDSILQPLFKSIGIHLETSQFAPFERSFPWGAPF